jgi:dTDP-glucose 4,6-dehydratase
MMVVNTLCRICRSTRLEKVLDLGLQPLANSFVPEDFWQSEVEKKYPLEMYVCRDCFLAQLIHVVDKETLFSDYIYFSSGMPKLSDHFQNYANDVIDRFLEDPYNLVVEVGSNDGILLKHFKDKGYRVLGIDPAKNIAKVANERGIETVVDFFSTDLAKLIAQKKGRAKTIIGNNVVAHIDDYQDLCQAVKVLLDTDGVFVFEAPYLLDMFENITFDTIYHEHLNFLAVKPLINLFDRFDLEIIDVKVVPKQGQSIRVFVGHKGSHKVRASVAACLVKEKAAGLQDIEAYHKLAKQVEKNKEKVSSLIEELKAMGKKIAVYGAPAKGNTLLNYYGINSAHLDFALDELPSKQGLYTPGTHLPVISRNRALQYKPDCYLLLAWNYSKVILEKEKDFLSSGGVFILPNGEIIRGDKTKVKKQTPTNTKKNILVCGGAGFIGSNFVRYIYKKFPGYTIYNLDLLTYSGNKNNLRDIIEVESQKVDINKRYHFVYGDICDSQLLDHLFVEINFDFVVNFAAESHVDRSLASSYDFVRTNIVGVHTLVEACSRHNVPRFLQVSTDEVYGDVSTGYSNEESPLNPSSPYSASKASADVLVKSYMRSHDLSALIVRGSNNFGPYQYPEKLIPLVISNFIEGRSIPVHGDGMHIRSWIHVLDFCEAIELVMHQGVLGQSYNVGGTHKSNMEVIESIWETLGMKGEISKYITHTNDRPGADLRYSPNHAKITESLGWSPKRPYDRYIDETVKWYLENEDWWRKIKAQPVFKEHYKRQEKADYF